MTVLGAQACVSCSAAHKANSLHTDASILVLGTCQTATLLHMLPELTLQAIVRHDRSQGTGDFDSGELELMLWW